MAIVFDSTHPLDPETVKRHGGIGVIYYLQTGAHPSWKSARPGQVAEAHDAGLGVGGVWEINTTRALQGYNAGMADARKANESANELGLPATLTLAWTVDTDVSGYGQVAEYDRGWRAGSSRPSAPYGEYSVIEGSIAAGRSRTGWQTNARGWSGRKISPHASLLQQLPQNLAGLGSVDPNIVVNLATPLLWWPGQPTVPTQPVPAFNPPAYPGKVLRVGDRGVHVAELKIMLVMAGYRGFAMKGDGVNVFTPGTKAAVWRYQVNNKLRPVTGEPGPRTWESLRQKVIAKHHAR